MGAWVVAAIRCSSVTETISNLALRRRATYGADVATIDLSSIDTGNPDRDNHIRAADFFEVDRHPAMRFRSTAVRRDGDHYALDGELTLKAVTKPITLRLDLGGFATDPRAGTRAGATAVGRLNRRDFGVDFNAILEAGIVVVGDHVDLHLEIEAVLNK